MDMPVPSGRIAKIKIIAEVRRRRRWNSEQKLAWVRRTTKPERSVSLAARGPLEMPHSAELKVCYFDLIGMINASVTGNGILPLHAHTFLDVWPAWVVANYRTRRFWQHHCWTRSSC
jgi:hypothetical protein